MNRKKREIWKRRRLLPALRRVWLPDKALPFSHITNGIVAGFDYNSHSVSKKPE